MFNRPAKKSQRHTLGGAFGHRRSSGGVTRSHQIIAFARRCWPSRTCARTATSHRMIERPWSREGRLWTRSAPAARLSRMNRRVGGTTRRSTTGRCSALGSEVVGTFFPGADFFELLTQDDRQGVKISGYSWAPSPSLTSLAYN